MPVQSISELRTGHLRDLMANRSWRIAVPVVTIVAGLIGIFVIPGANPVLGFLVVAAAVAIAALVVTYLIADRKARSSFMAAWAAGRGWQLGNGIWQDNVTPLLRMGDDRSSDEHVSGPLDGAARATLCHYTYETKSTDSEGNTTTTDHDFTVVQVTPIDTEIQRLTLHPRSFGSRWFDRIDSALTSDRVVNLESEELEKEYKLEIHDTDSDLAIRLVFEPTFITWCIDQAGDDLMIEIEDGVLLVAIPDHSYDAAALDRLVDRAVTVTTRLADAYATTAKEA